MEYAQKMDKAIEATQREFSRIRAGQATPAILNEVRVDYYGTMTPLSNIAKITAPEPRMLMVSPWEKPLLELIEKAILAANLGITPMRDGGSVRISMPILTQERRQELAKIVRKHAEEGRVAIRNIRREAMEAVKKTKDLPEDQVKKLQDDVQKMTDKYIAKVDEIATAKEQDLLKV